jgi:hypothetical protein
MLQKDYFKDHPLWKPLELELHKRRNNLNNQQLAQVVHAFGTTGNATKFLFEELEETIIDSPISIETPYLCKMLQGYSLVNMGSPIFYKHCQDVILKRKFKDLKYVEIADVCRDFARATQLPKGSQVFYGEVEKYIRTELAQGRFTSFTELCRFSEIIFSVNVCTNEFQTLLETKIIEGLNKNPSL